MQQKKQVELLGEYRFCCCEGNPDSLVMIKRPSKLIDQIYSKPHVLWIHAPTNQSIDQKSRICSQIGCQIAEFKSVVEASSYLKENKLKSVLIICSNQLDLILSQQKQVISIVCYCQDMDWYHEKKKNKTIGAKFQKATIRQKQLIKWLNDKISKNLEQKQLAIFISFKYSVEKSNTKMKILSVILNQNVKRSQLSEDIREFLLLASSISKRKIQQFYKLLNQQHSLHEFFCKQSSFLSILNYLLRCSKNPLDSLIMQPAISDIFNYIRRQYNKNKTKMPELAKFYREAHISEKQLQVLKGSIGTIIQNQGFLRVNKKQATITIENVLFIITVDNSERRDQIDFGLVQVSDQTVLFNHLNSFKVVRLQWNKTKKYYQIELSYGQLASIAATSGQLDSNLTYMRNLADTHINFMNKYSLIGHVLTEDNRSFPGSLQFWNKYVQLLQAQQKTDKNSETNALIFLGKTLLNESKYKQAQQIFKKVCQMRSTLQHPKQSIGYAMALSNLAIAYQKQKMMKQAEQCHKQSLEIKKKIYFQKDPTHVSFAATYNNLAKICLSEKKFDNALEYFTKCQKIDEKKLGPYHPNLAITLGNMGAVYFHQQKYDLAQSQYERARQIQQKTLGQSHPDYICTLRNLIKISHQKGQKYKQNISYRGEINQASQTQFLKSKQLQEQIERIYRNSQ